MVEEYEFYLRMRAYRRRALWRCRTRVCVCRRKSSEWPGFPDTCIGGRGRAHLVMLTDLCGSSVAAALLRLFASKWFDGYFWQMRATARCFCHTGLKTLVFL